MKLGATRRLWIVEPIEEIVAPATDEEETAAEREHEPEPRREPVPAGA